MVGPEAGTRHRFDAPVSDHPAAWEWITGTEEAVHRDLGDTTAWIEVAALVLEGRGQILNKY